MSEEEFNRLASFISEKFNASLDAVVMALRVTEMPILATDCTVVVENPQKWVDFSDAPFADPVDDEGYEEDWWGED